MRRGPAPIAKASQNTARTGRTKRRKTEPPPRHPKNACFLGNFTGALVSSGKIEIEHCVLVSCKITHSVMTYLDRRGEDLGELNDFCDWPTEFLRDPSSWLEADKMENLLKLIDQNY